MYKMKRNYFLLGALTCLLSSAMVLGSMSCKLTPNQKTAVDQATHLCIAAANLACRQDLAELCQVVHDVNALTASITAELAAGNTACAVPSK